jgi:hypothetical protein
MDEWTKSGLFQHGSEVLEHLGDDVNASVVYGRFYRSARVLHALREKFGKRNVKRTPLLYGKGSVFYVLTHTPSQMQIAVGHYLGILRVWTPYADIDDRIVERDAVLALVECARRPKPGPITRSKHEID